MRLSENAVTALLSGVCLVGGAVALAPRALVRLEPLVVEQPPVQVAVQGEVARPGVYELPFGSRVEDAVAAAGGLLPTAARDLLRLAAPVNDGQTVHVPGAAVAGTERPRVSLNSAALEELDALPGVGPVIAERIAAHRPYAAVDELLEVPGIGPATLERLRPLVGL
ncbi:MAG TPA: ComEA family DNA-binding protein [Trueperaceae bacterium]|nr:ComEA family DNA-binding protein [Trueperaceae bacterium]